jgi:hypothetical protein
MIAALSLSNDTRPQRGAACGVAAEDRATFDRRELSAGQRSAVCPSGESRSSAARCKRVGHEALWFHQFTDG